MPFPKNRSELEAQGYRFLSKRKCMGKTCGRMIEMWLSPHQRSVPLDVDENGNVEPHFSTCCDVKDFRKKA